MLTYITAFIFYTLAMIGVLMGGFVLYKKAFAPIKNENKGLIQILDNHSIAPKKSLMVVRIKNEVFLIALDSERTTFLAKLNTESKKSADKELQKKLSEENYYIENDIDEEIKNALLNKSQRFDDTGKSNNDELQRQFMRLYEQNEPEAHKIQPDELSRRKQMIRHLINEFNNDKKAGSKF